MDGRLAGELLQEALLGRLADELGEVLFSIDILQIGKLSGWFLHPEILRSTKPLFLDSSLGLHFLELPVLHLFLFVEPAAVFFHVLLELQQELLLQKRFHVKLQKLHIVVLRKVVQVLVPPQVLLVQMYRLLPYHQRFQPYR